MAEKKHNTNIATSEDFGDGLNMRTLADCTVRRLAFFESWLAYRDGQFISSHRVDETCLLLCVVNGRLLLAGFLTGPYTNLMVIENHLNGENWSDLLCERPLFYAHCDRDKLDREHWLRLVRYQPRLAVHCDWSKLNGENWSDLLEDCPKFADHCDWSKLGRAERRKLFSVRPEFRKIARLRDKTQK